MEERKVGVQITASSDDVDVTTPESEIVKAKLENHHIKQLANLLKVLGPRSARERERKGEKKEGKEKEKTRAHLVCRSRTPCRAWRRC